MNAAAKTLELARDPQVTLADLALHLGESVAFAAGLVEAIVGDCDWAHARHEAGQAPAGAERHDYEQGFAAGIELIDGPALDAVHGTLADWAAALDAASADAIAG